jgi:hypothetical protein
MNMKKFHSLLTVILFSGMLSGCLTNLDSSNPQYGLVFGKVTIGPLCPVEPCQISEEQIDKIYAERKIIIYMEDSSTVVQTVSIDEDRHYEAYLLPGHYVIDINHNGIDRSGDVPKAIAIEEGKIIRLDIDIDTGIR